MCAHAPLLSETWLQLTMRVSALPPVSPSKTTCLLRSAAGGVDEEVVSFLSDLKEFKQLKKVKMTEWKNLSPSLIATVCGGLCSSNSMEEVVVRPQELITRFQAGRVNVLSVCLTPPHTLCFC